MIKHCRASNMDGYKETIGTALLIQQQYQLPMQTWSDRMSTMIMLEIAYTIYFS